MKTRPMSEMPVDVSVFPPCDADDEYEAWCDAMDADGFLYATECDAHGMIFHDIDKDGDCIFYRYDPDGDRFWGDLSDLKKEIEPEECAIWRNINGKLAYWHEDQEIYVFKVPTFNKGDS